MPSIFSPPGSPGTLPAEVLADLAFDQGADLLVVIRVADDGRFFIERMNPSATAFFSRRVFAGAAEPDFYAMDMASLMAKSGASTATVDALLAPHREAVRTRRPVSRDADLSTTGGERLARSFVLTPVLNAAGRLTHLFYRGIDNTRLRSAEQKSAQASREAQETGERFATLFEISAVPLSIVRSRDGVRVQANAAWLAFHGRTREESVGTPSRERSVWANPADLEEMVSELRRTGRGQIRLARMIGAGGAIRTARIAMQSILWDGEPCSVTSTQDVTDLELARAEAQAARARLEAILEQSPVGISISSLADGRYRYVNPAWCRTYGIARERALVIDSVQSGFWPSHEERLASYGPLRKPGSEVQVSRTFQHPDGRITHVLLSAQLMEYDGESCALALTQDVTARELAREAARLSGERFAKLFEMSPVPLVIGRTADGAYLAANRAFLDLHGYRRDELVGKTSVTRGVWPSLEERERVIQQLRRDGEVRALPQTFRGKDGGTIHTLYYATRIDWQGEEAVLAAPQDITGIVNARRDAEVQGARFQALFRLAPNPASVTRSSDGCYLALNDAWAKALGFTPEEMLGRRSLELGIWLSEDDRDFFVRALRTGRALRQLPVRFRTRSGEIRRMRISSEIIDWDGEQAILSSMNDVTDLERAAEEIRGLNESLEQKVRERTAALEHALGEIESFSYTVSHDLRAPLRHVSVFSDLLRERESVRADAKAADYAGRMGAAARRLGAMIDSLLEYSRLGRKQITPGSVDLAAQAAQVVAELGAQAAGRRVSWDLGALPVVQGDAMLLRLLLQNLLDNALKYTRTRAEARIAVRARRDGAFWEIEVADNGVGFDMQYSDKLFGVFQRLHGEREFEGTGVGLAHAARIVARHGGRIWCDAVQDHGATFRFTLPAGE